MKKIFLLVVLFVVGLIAFSLYQRDSEPQISQITISGPFEFHGLDLSKNGFTFSRLGVTESLTGIQGDGHVFPRLATEWQQSEDGLTWQFKIRDNVSFHDGTPLDGKAVLKTLTYAREKPGVIKQIPIKSMSADGQTFTLNLSRPYVPLLTVLAHYSLGIVSPAAYDEQGQITQLYGTGPYQVNQLIAPHKANVRRFEGYWGTQGEIDEISYLAGHRSESRALMVESGQAQIAFSIDPNSRTMFENNPDVSVQSYNLPRTILLKVNNTHPFLSEKQARQAISLALDRKAIASSILHAPGSEAYQLFSDAQADWHINNYQPKQNLDTAASLLYHLGWRKNDKGWLVRDGQLFSLTLSTYADRPELPVLATTIQDQLSRIGIMINVNIDNSSVIPVKHHDNTLNLALIARNFGTLGSPLPALFDDFSSPKGSDWGHMNWYSPRIHHLLALLISGKEPDQAVDMSQEVARILADELPVIPIAYSQQLVGISSRVSGFRFDPYEIDYHLTELKTDD
ncbi:Glutathione-binding protein GsiB precursor [Vibrio aerogenes CECT 7868]|uniref:Glutathione-binding protein GsiB n=1 Tax=Vibrio aerogenes CECT 7868 TaxID=1216006 RepID=A0A1M6DBY4_9VIBR|nr:ABC transporter substrate-binding protein [Vibrio aerogenes]SHI70774.1 Glutathione-binding protein GsiB precursor [Vibrio aerogenes CECT 7868]